MNRRYEAVLDCCDRYLIWDMQAALPVAVPGRLIWYARASEAEAAAASLNAAEAEMVDDLIRQCRPIA